MNDFDNISVSKIMKRKLNAVSSGTESSKTDKDEEVETMEVESGKWVKSFRVFYFITCKHFHMIR